MPPARGSGHEFTADATPARRPAGRVLARGGQGRYGHTVPLRGTASLIR
jgi:hypothetical protein